MYRSDISIRHRNKSHLFWGLDKETNDVVYISQVKNRGLDCNCRCAHCGEDFIARLGEVNKHHFAHKSNYECVYSNEIAVYLLAKKYLQSMQTLTIPAVGFYFGSRRDYVETATEAAIGEVFYQCDPQQYPPLLVAEINNEPTRIILSFAKYYTTEDYLLLKREAKHKNWNCLLIDLPRIEDESSISVALLKMALKGCESDKRWIYHCKASGALKELQALSITPKAVLPEGHSTNYDCPLHRQKYNQTYYARPADCDGCPYNLAEHPDCKCLAHIGVQSYKDLQKSLDERMKKVSELRSANELRIQVAQQEAERRTMLRNTMCSTLQPKIKPTAPQQQPLSREDRLAKGKQEIMANFNPYSDEIAFDSFGRRWVQCKLCQRILPSEECPMYGGRGTANLGVCYDCSRK